MTRAPQPRPFAAAWRPLLTGAALAAFTFLCYRAILPNAFLAEDLWQSQILVYDWWVQTAFYPGGGGYRPLMFTFWAVASRLWANHPLPYRVVIVALHLLNGALVYALARRLTHRRLPGLAAGLLFVSFAPSVEAVDWLSAASNQVTSLFGYLLALRAAVTLVGQRSPRRRYYVLGVAGLLIALGANEMALTWPAVALLLAAVASRAEPGSAPLLAWLDRRWLRTTFVRLWPLLAVWTGFLVLRTILVRGLGGYGPAVHLRAGSFLINDLVAYAGFFTAPWTWPMRLFGPAAMLEAWVAGSALLGLLVLVAALVVARPALWAVVVTLVMLLPAWNIPAPHRGYFVGVGVSLMVVTAFAYWQRRLVHWRLGALGPSLVLIALALLLVLQLRTARARHVQHLAAGDWSRQVLSATSALVPAPAPATTFYYLDLPQTHAGIYVFTWGLREAVQKHYHDLSLDAYQVYVPSNPGRLQRGTERTVADAVAADDAAAVYLIYQPGPQGEAQLTRVSAQEFAAIAAAQ